MDSEGQPVDAAFYRTFWGLQATFQAPYPAMEPSRWAATIADIKRVLVEFGKQVWGSLALLCYPVLWSAHLHCLTPSLTRFVIFLFPS